MQSLVPFVPPGWTDVCIANLDQVLQDHAHCEKKAAASALSLLSSYPQHSELVRRAAALAQEELRHFAQVHRLLLRRAVPLGPDAGDPYVQALRRTMRHGLHHHLTDRLLVSALVEARSCERLSMLGAALETATAPEARELAPFYMRLARCEAGHARLFVRLAKVYDDPQAVAVRLQQLSAQEADICRALPVLPRIH